MTVSDSRGFSLVEVVLAIGVCAFAILAIFALLPIGLTNQLASLQQTAATNIATAIVGDLNAVPRDEAISPLSGLNVTLPAPQSLLLDESGSPTTNEAAARFKATLTLSPPPAGSRTATLGKLEIEGFPAKNASPRGSVTVFVALDRN